VAGVKGEISTPHFPEYYPHRISCEWIIFVRNGYHVKLEFTHFDLEYCMFCKCDYVEIRDGRNSSAPLIGKFCESSRLGTIFSTGRYLWVKFYSDVGGRFQGFRAVYTAQKNGKIVAGVKGEISTPHFPEYYPHRISCEWIIFVRNGYHVKLEFTHFDLEYCMFCKCDYVEIRDGRNSSAPLIGKFCESSRLGTIFSTGRYLWVKFYSDVGGRFQGFRAVYTAQKNGKSK
ncbi:predicted protein, partial [Nematostella vectensis]